MPKYSNVFEDELKLKGRQGIYAFVVGDKLDLKHKTIFKVGMTASSFQKRANHYHSYYKDGLWVAGVLYDFPVRKNGFKTKRNLYLYLEDLVFKFLINNGAKRVKTKTSENETEYFYTSYSLIHKAFQYITRTFGLGIGIYQPFEDLEKTIQNQYNKRIKQKNTVSTTLLYDLVEDNKFVD
jgi:hypothetical protein